MTPWLSSSFGNGVPSSGGLADRLVVEDHAADVVGGALGREQQVAVGAPGLLGRLDADRVEALLDRAARSRRRPGCPCPARRARARSPRGRVPSFLLVSLSSPGLSPLQARKHSVWSCFGVGLVWEDFGHDEDAGAVVAGRAPRRAGRRRARARRRPSNTSPPTISGTERAGETLTASSGSWSGSTPIVVPLPLAALQLERQQAATTLGGATNQTYTLEKGDAGHRIRVSVTATNSDGSANAVSAPTGVIADGLSPMNTAMPTISGTAKAGRRCRRRTARGTNGPTSFSYQWRRCDTSGNNCHDVGPNKTHVRARTTATSARRSASTVRARNPFGSNHGDLRADRCRRGRRPGAREHRAAR